MMIEKPDERREADRDDGAPHPLLADALGEARAGVSTDHSARRHRERDRPVDDPPGREHDDRHAVDAHPAPVLSPFMRWMLVSPMSPSAASMRIPIPAPK